MVIFIKYAIVIGIMAYLAVQQGRLGIKVSLCAARQKLLFYAIVCMTEGMRRGPSFSLAGTNGPGGGRDFL